MQQVQQYKIDSLHRSLQFLDSHDDVLGAVNETPARQQLNASVAELAVTTVEQHTRSRETIGEKHNQRSLERKLKRGHMSPASRFARAELQGVPNFKALTPGTADLKGPKLANTAKAMAEAARPYVAHFTAAQFPADFLEQLVAAADAVTGSIGARSMKHLQRVGATKQVEDAVKRGRTAVAALDAIVTRMFLNEPRLLEEWRVAKRVVSKPGAVRVVANRETVAEPVAPPNSKAA